MFYRNQYGRGKRKIIKRDTRRAHALSALRKYKPATGQWKGEPTGWLFRAAKFVLTAIKKERKLHAS